jgi:hypothetical protein
MLSYVPTLGNQYLLSAARSLSEYPFALALMKVAASLLLRCFVMQLEIC